MAVVIVCHNHEATLGLTIESVLSQRPRPDQVIVVDCGSRSAPWQNDGWTCAEGVEVVFAGGNLGFTGGCNLGWTRIRSGTEWVLFLNPDVLVPDGVLNALLNRIDRSGEENFGLFSPRLEGYDFAKGSPTGRLDSTGIFPSGLGWADRRVRTEQRDEFEAVPALCGAFMLGRVEVLRGVARSAEHLFDERYFAYKEDIELSLRLRRSGWMLGMWHGGEAFHGRGWKLRADMSRFARRLSARNEIRLHAVYAPLRLPVSLIKWLLVIVFDR